MNELLICVRCGCPIVPGTAQKKLVYKSPPPDYWERMSLISFGWFEQDGEHPWHNRPEDCLVALRRKEVEQQKT